MLKHRVIPTLLLSKSGLVKTRRFKDPQYIGDPVNAIRIFNEKEVDELLLVDISATKEGKEPQYGLIERCAGECFMPLAYGGGIKTSEQAKTLFSLGIEKICLQSAVLQDYAFVSTLADLFGSQSIMVAIDVKRNWLKAPMLYLASQERTLSMDWARVLEDLVEAGAGEVLLNAVNQDGTMAGPDLDLIRMATDLTDVPLIAAGGIGSLTDIRRAIEAGADAVAAGAFFVFHGPHRAVLITYPDQRALNELFALEATI
jgi:cyclase